MSKFLNYFKNNFVFLVLSGFLFLEIFNPVFKKYDYGAGFPMVLVFGVLLLIFAVFEFKKKRETSKSAILEKIFLMIFLIFYVLSFVFSQTKNIGFSELLAFSSVVVFYILFAYKKEFALSRSEEDRSQYWGGNPSGLLKENFSEKFLKTISIFSILALIVGYFLYFLQPETRMVGPFLNILDHSNVWPNAFALFLLITWPVYLFLSEKKYAWQVSILIGFAISGLLLTYSRGAIIVLGGQVVLLFFYFLKRIRVRTILLIFLSIATAIFLFFGANYVRSMNFKVMDAEKRAAFQNSESLTSGQERIDFWKGALELIKQKPLFGWGPFSFRQAYNPIQKTFLGNGDHPHNVFLKIGAENGLIALFGFLAFFVSIFVIVLKRFFKLSNDKKDFVYVLGVCAAGAFAHNLIDYNFNFFSNLLILFIFLALIRSAVVQKETIKKGVFGLILAIVVCGFSLYEGTLLVLDKTVDESYLEYSLYPRSYYLDSADKAVNAKKFDEAEEFINKELKLNPLDARAWYLKGVIFCDEKNPEYNLSDCEKSFMKALELNSMNDFEYYVSYYRVLLKLNINDKVFNEKIVALLNQYFSYVQNNVHFTAYTKNVETAAELVDFVVLNFALEDRINGDYKYYDEINRLLQEKAKMLETANRLRMSKTF